MRTTALDACRYLLPAAALANLGMTANARVLEHAISKMLSSPLAEVQQIGQEVRAAAQVETPTLVKYANPVPYLQTGPGRLQPGRWRLAYLSGGRHELAEFTGI